MGFTVRSEVIRDVWLHKELFIEVLILVLSLVVLWTWLGWNNDMAYSMTVETALRERTQNNFSRISNYGTLQVIQLREFLSALCMQNCRRRTCQSHHTLDRRCSYLVWQTSVHPWTGGTSTVHRPLRDTCWQAATSRKSSDRGSTWLQARRTPATTHCLYSTHRHVIPASISALKTAGSATATATILLCQVCQYLSEKFWLPG